jgi:metal transporter CNNM
MVKKLIVLDPNERRTVRDVPLRSPLLAHPDAGLLETLNAFQQGRSHMALVTRDASLLERAWRRDEDVAEGAVEILGLITVEDVLEELIGEEIADEDDYVTELTRSFPPAVFAAARKFKLLLARRRARRLRRSDSLESRDEHFWSGPKGFL